ncbi:glycoside hydrolase family 16 protein (plasmid) [Skermanella sp. TT6]|uniref:Glycoside hydrolase family 16 protein n=1 Tax=Skermanella cutis TaxID=2775420 RepID=A0ABX7BEC7_9PROT|nr:glycoside hydrolase family 16 protein [Skermanella sp. TT6]QQP92769.1 glycoside hydrolase family 16 protein [Skermanella sp. TT6]
MTAAVAGFAVGASVQVRADVYPAESDGYRRTFAAEFDDPSLALPGPMFATSYVTWGGLRTLAGNQEAQLYIDETMPDVAKAGVGAFSIADGKLAIEARPTPEILMPSLGSKYISGMLTTEPSFRQRYGYFEIRARLPLGRGLWPAFWLVGDTHSEHLEIDVFEVLGHEPDRIYLTVKAPQRQIGYHEGFRPGIRTDHGFHRYGVEWTPDEVVFFLDGAELKRVNARLDVPMYMIVNLAVGGTWPGQPDKTTEFPARMEIDYIRAYRKLDGPEGKAAE